MSHHFDTPTGRQDPRINVCDFYLFRGRPGFTVMAMTVNPDAGGAAPDTLREEGLYAFRFDLDGDAKEEVAFKLRFGAPTDASGGGGAHRHLQAFEVRRATGAAARRGVEGELLLAGNTGGLVKNSAGAMAFIGLAPDLFAGDAAASRVFLDALNREGRFDPDAYRNRTNFFAGRNVTAMVLELPSECIGEGLVHGWATASLHGHAEELQVARWGLPLITHLFMPDLAMREDYNRAVPADDLARFSSQIGKVAEKLTGLAGSASNPAAYAERLIARLCPTMLPYRLDTPAAFDYVGFNGRALGDDVMDVMLTLATNSALGDGVAPDKTRTRREFPYFGEPYSAATKLAGAEDQR